MAKTICLYLFLFISTVIHARDRVDSLISVLEGRPLPALEELETLKNICLEYHKIYQAKKSFGYARKGLSIAEKQKDLYYESVFTECLGHAYDNNEEYAKALEHYQKAIQLAEKNGDRKRILSTWVSISSYYGNRSELTLALEYFFKALPLAEETGDKETELKLLSNIGSVYRVLGHFDKSIEYFQKVLTISEKDNNATGIKRACYELGLIYRTIKEYEKAEQYLMRSLHISREIGDKVFEAINFQALAILSYRKEPIDYKKSEAYAKESLLLFEEIGNKYYLSSSWATLASVYSEQKKYEESIEAALKAWECDTTNLNLGISIFYNLIESNICLGHKEEALKYLQKYADVKAMINDENMQTAFSEMETRYETEKKENQIAALEKEKNLYYGFGITGMITLLLIIVQYITYNRFTKQKRKLVEQQIKKLEQEKQLIATQSVLEGETNERMRLARDLHDGLGGMLSVIKLNLTQLKQNDSIKTFQIPELNTALDILDQSMAELRNIAHYLMPESLMRYGLKTALEDFCRAVPEARFRFMGEYTRLESRLEILIYRSAYELINNALKYANATCINIQLIIDNGLISLNISDDGTGFDPEKTGFGAGLRNIQTRVSSYNGNMQIHSSPGNGTEVNIEIELR